MMLANLVFVSRHEHEIERLDDAAHWAGMPEYDASEDQPQLMVTFPDEAARVRFIELIEATESVKTKKGKIISIRWPIVTQRHDWDSVRFEADP